MAKYIPGKKVKYSTTALDRHGRATPFHKSLSKILDAKKVIYEEITPEEKRKILKILNRKREPVIIIDKKEIIDDANKRSNHMKSYKKKKNNE